MASQIKYDVFVSFRGTDVRSSFLSHLKKEMWRNKVDFFVDDDGLERGDEISPTLLTAIEESYISLVIFSEDYASSRWCLEELVKIIECKDRNKQIVIPVFYNIDPSEVRHQKGIYADAFANYEENKGNLAKVPNWRSALNIAANISGFHSSKFGDEAELIEEIVKCLMSKLNRTYQSGLTDLVGIEERIANVESLLRQGSTTDVRVIGIWGMGGIGKTTIADAIYNRLCFEYDGCCFLANIMEESKNHGMIYLKNKIFSKLLKEDVQIDTPNGVPPYVKGRLVRKKVLIVLDDINDSEHLENLVGALDLFGFGSRIIVTTRNKQVLSNKVDNDNIYEAKALSSDEATKLFISNAFKKNGNDMEWIELSRWVIQYANGNPLALKLLGSFLCGKSKIEWESQLRKLKKMPHSKVQNALRLTYDGLDQEEKEIFLYIACFLKGYEFQRIISLLDACGFATNIGLKVLHDKALIIEAKDFGRRSIVWMHDLIQEMGWQIVREECVDDPGQRSRLWDPNDILQVLKNNTGTETIKSITLNISESDELSLGPRVFARMKQLKFFQVTQSYGQKPILYFPEGLEYLPNDLRLFHWDGFPLKSLPQSFCVENLVELKMTSSRVEKLWDGIQNLENLRRIDLSDSEYLLELPDFSKASNLEEVELCGCRNLRNVHPSILSLNKLVQLNLVLCKALTSLRGETHLRSLRELYLHGCSSLKDFSVTSENMEVLGLTSTAINELPSSIYSLKKLQTLFLIDCKSLNYLPNKLADLRSLEHLKITRSIILDASNLHILIKGLRSLKMLLLEECPNLIEIPENISLLSSLSWLSLRGINIERFPASIKHLSKLKRLDIQGCTRLYHLPELPLCITELYANNCSSLKTVIFTSRATKLLQAYDKINIQFQNCHKLDELSLSAIGVNAHAYMKKFAYENLSTTRNRHRGNVFYHGSRLRANVIYPGSEVPEWFMYKTTQTSVIVDLSCAPPSKFMGFIFCAIIIAPSPSVGANYINCDINLETGSDERVRCRLRHRYSGMVSYGKFLSEHVCLWYDEGQLLQDREFDNGTLEEVITSYNPKLSFKFFAQNGINWEMKEEIMIKGCGVCPLFDTEDFTFIKQMKLEMQSIATEKSVTRFDKKETLAPKQQYKKFFPHPQIETWKSATQGLKDILLPHPQIKTWNPQIETWKSATQGLKDIFLPHPPIETWKTATRLERYTAPMIF